MRAPIARPAGSGREETAAAVPPLRLLLLFSVFCLIAAPVWGADAGPTRRFSGYLLVAASAPAQAREEADATVDWAELGIEVIVRLPAGAATSPRDEGGLQDRIWLALPPPREESERSATTNPWDVAHAALRTSDQENTGLLARVFERLEAAGATPLELEPDLSMVVDSEALQRHLASATSHESAQSAGPFRAPASRAWPHPEDPLWHLRDEYSQLARAREAARPDFEADLEVIQIAHLDTGYDPNHPLLPRRFDRVRSRDLTDTPAAGRIEAAPDPGRKGFLKFPGHGTGTLGLLAGGRICYPSRGSGVTCEDVGGAPLARIVSYRVSDSVIHLYPRTLARAVRLATDEGADVLSLSMGGLPSGALRDAVNYAYSHGTALFAATGDFFVVPVLGLRTPSSVVYPARFSRVVGVTGVTADLLSYARAPSLLGWLRNFRSWSLRGSAGPRAAMTRTVAAYAPNVPWAVWAPSAPTGACDLDGAGTSAATPQVAAAASLWLQRHRTQLRADWRTWRKAESVYRVLFATASCDACSEDVPDRHFGMGRLRAAEALERDAPVDLTPQEPARIGLGWLELVTSVRPASSPRLERITQAMFRTEIAQLLLSQRRLAEFAYLADVTTRPSNRAVASLLHALLRSPEVSASLRQAISTTLAEIEG